MTRDGAQRAFLDTLRAGEWTTTDAPLPRNSARNPNATVDSVSCVGDGHCAAVGSYDDSRGAYETVLDAWHKGRWKASRAPLPADAASRSAIMSGISCGTAICVASGYYSLGQSDRGLIETLTGRTWTATEQPLPSNAAAGTGSVLSPPSCGGSRMCATSGSYVDRDGVQQGLIETFSGNKWKATKAPMPSNAVSESGAIGQPSCGENVCATTGYYEDGSTTNHGVLEAFEHGTWKATELSLPDPSSDPDPVLDTPSCSAKGVCVTAGFYGGGHGNRLAFLATLNKGTWSVTKAHMPAGAAADANPTPFETSCSVICASVGDYKNSHGDARELIETLRGKRWTPTGAPVPAGAAAQQDPEIDGLSCNIKRICVTAGHYDDANGIRHGVIETLMDRKWTATKAPLPPNSRKVGSYLTDASCGQSITCVVTGSYVNGHGHVEALTETLRSRT